MGTPQRARILILHSIKMRSVTFSALALALALAVGGASAQIEVGGWEECPTPYEMGFGGDKIGYIIANTYDSAGQSPKCMAPGTNNGPDGAVNPNNFDTQNIIECHVQDAEGLNYNFVLNAKDGVLFCNVVWPLPNAPTGPEYDCSLHEHAKNKYPCVPGGTCSKHCLHHGCKQE